MTKNKNIDLIKNMAEIFEPTEKEHKEFESRIKNIVAKQKSVDEIADNLGRKLRQGETISKQEHNEFYKSMKEHLQKLKK
tara:strand:- start:162 stop:401 length:240 start_codon:yes stop_codon:yes gene_type:complete